VAATPAASTLPPLPAFRNANATRNLAAARDLLVQIDSGAPGALRQLAAQIDDAKRQLAEERVRTQELLWAADPQVREGRGPAGGWLGSRAAGQQGGGAVGRQL
jgi:hypothetical protein